jgi:hypothetical protein
MMFKLGLLETVALRVGIHRTVLCSHRLRTNGKPIIILIHWQEISCLMRWIKVYIAKYAKLRLRWTDRRIILNLFLVQR